MLKELGNQLRGYLKIRITGYSPERFLNLCKHKEIAIWELEAEGNAYEMYMTVSDFRKLKPILRKTRTRITVLERYGVPFFFHKYRKRKIFFAGVFACLILVFVLSKFIWGIEISGNQTITDEVLLEYLETQEVYHGMWKKNVKCESIVTNIRKEFNDIIWVSASLDGCNVVIQVKENADTFQVSQTEESPADLISTADGTIVKIITRSGVPCVKEGDTVKVGDLLVSGTVEVKNDAGEVVREDYKTADADVYAEVMIPYEDLCETLCQEKVYTNRCHKLIYFDMFGYRVGLGIRKSETKNYEILSEETQLKLNKNFKLPIVYGVYRGKEYKLQNRERAKEEKEAILSHNLELYCKELEESGVEILEKQIEFIEEMTGMKAKGYFKVKQSIVASRKSVDF